MKFNNQRIFILLLMVLLTVQACVSTNSIQDPSDSVETSLDNNDLAEVQVIGQPTAQPVATPTVGPAFEPDPGEWIDILPIDQGDGQVLLWSGAAIASSSAGPYEFNVKQALGKPNTLACGRFVTAWQPAADETEAWIELYYSPDILPEYVYINQSYLPDQISKLDVVNVNGQEISVFDRDIDEVYQPVECPAMRSFWLANIQDPIRSVRITLQREEHEDWTQIDAVGVLGFIEDGPTEPMVADQWSENEYEDPYGDFYTPRYFSNKNRVNDLVFAGDRLVAATDGGVVVWDTDLQKPVAYTAAHGLPTNATSVVAYCNGDDQKIIVGGVDGIGVFARDKFDSIQDFDDEFFTQIDHPGDEFLGGVTALACDPVREHIWVGYLGHLSRYDLQLAQWTEFGYDDGMPMDVVRQIKIINEDIWVATAYGVAVIQNGSRVTAYTPENSKIPAMFVHAIAADKTDRLWMASSNGLIEFDGRSWGLWQSSEIAGGLMTDIMMGLEVDPTGDLWVVDTNGVLCQFNPSKKQCSRVIEPPEYLGGITAFEIGDQGQMALADFKDGIRLFQEEVWLSLKTEDQILDNIINAIAYAPDGNIWLATREGLQFFTANQPFGPWQHMPLIANAQPLTFCVASDGLWIGHTQGARFLPYLDSEPVDFAIGDPENAIANSVTAIAVDQDHRVYFGTYGLSIWDGSQFFFEDLLSAEERSRNTYPSQVNVLYADGDVVWVGASNGLYQFQNGQLIESWGDRLSNLTKTTRSVGAILPAPDGDGLLVAVGRNLYRLDADAEADAFNYLLELDSEIRGIYAMPYALVLTTSRSGYYMLPKDDFGIYWDLVSGGGGFARRFGYQSVVMSDNHTLWIASGEGGLQRTQALFSQ